MSRDLNFVDNTGIIPADYLNDLEEITTGLALGVRLDLQSAATQVRLIGDALTENSYAIRIGQKPRYGAASISVTGSGPPGTYGVYATSAVGLTPKHANLELTTGTPSAAFYRQIGSAEWSGSVFTNLRLTTGVQANADQYNQFIFRPLVASSTPLTVRGLVSQTADLFRVEDSSGTSIFSVTTSGPSTATIQAGSAFVAPAGTVSAPSYTFTGDLTTGMYSPGAGTVALAANTTNFLAVSATGVRLTTSISTPLSFNGDASLYRQSAGVLAVAAGTTLNLVSSSLTMNGTLLASSHLSDSAGLVRTAGTTFTGAVYLAVGSTALPGLVFAGDATTGLHSPGAGQVSLANGALDALVTNAGAVSLPQTSSPTTTLSVGATPLYGGSGSGITHTGTEQLTMLGQYLEVRKSNGASSLVLSRPDGTRIGISLDNSNALVFTPV